MNSLISWRTETILFILSRGCSHWSEREKYCKIPNWNFHFAFEVKFKFPFYELAKWHVHFYTYILTVLAKTNLSFVIFVQNSDLPFKIKHDVYTRFLSLYSLSISSVPLGLWAPWSSTPSRALSPEMRTWMWSTSSSCCSSSTTCLRGGGAPCSPWSPRPSQRYLNAL